MSTPQADNQGLLVAYQPGDRVRVCAPIRGLILYGPPGPDEQRYMDEPGVVELGPNKKLEVINIKPNNRRSSLSPGQAGPEDFCYRLMYKYQREKCRFEDVLRGVEKLVAHADLCLKKEDINTPFHKLPPLPGKFYKKNAKIYIAKEYTVPKVENGVLTYIKFERGDRVMVRSKPTTRTLASLALDVLQPINAYYMVEKFERVPVYDLFWKSLEHVDYTAIKGRV